MKKIILLFALVLSSCNPLKDISTEGLTYDSSPLSKAAILIKHILQLRLH